MWSHRIILLLTVLNYLVLRWTPLNASEVSFEFDATVTSSSFVTDLVGETGWGRIRYDTDQVGGFTGAGYYFETPPAEFTFHLSDMDFVAGSRSDGTTGVNFEIDLRNDRVVLINNPPMDAVLYWANNISQTLNGSNVRMVLALHDSSASVLSDTSLPTSPPDLSDFDIYNLQLQLEQEPGTHVLGLSLSVDSIRPGTNVVSTYTIGGVVYTDPNDPLTTGLEGVHIDVSGDNGNYQTETSDAQGSWQIPDVNVGIYTVAPSKSGWGFDHTISGVSDGQSTVVITVDDANQAANQEIEFLGERTVLLHDWNGDGIVSIVGDVPEFVNCVYFNHCPNDVDPVAVGDCSGDGLISLVGDVPCFVDCVYFGNCPLDGNVPSILGEYTGSYTMDVDNCSDPEMNDMYHFSVVISIDSQDGDLFSGTAIGTTSDLGFPVSEHITLSGIIDATGEISGDTSHTFLNTGGVGTFTGQLSGDTLSIVNSGHDTFGDICTYTRSISAVR
jgi:hypothetical protein